MIVCASRRTDVPAFHSEWMINRLREEYVLVRNPMVKNLVHEIELTSRNVDCIVFLSKNPKPMIQYLDEIDEMGFNYIFQVTINPYSSDVEPNVPFAGDVADSFKEISQRIGKERMVWRYDPIILNGSISMDYHVRKFNTFCKDLNGHTSQCIFSFVDMYEKIGDANLGLRDIRPEEKDEIGRRFSEIANGFDLELVNCCSRYDLSKYGIKDRGCIDPSLLNGLGIPYEMSSQPLRVGCKCVKNVDIGEYDTCNHNCVYCYANRRGGSKRKERVYDPKSPMLLGALGESDIVRKLGSRSIARITDF